MIIDAYTISGTVDDGSTLEEVSVSSIKSSCTLEGLSVGTWTLTIDACNANDDRIYSFSKDVDVSRGETSFLSLTLEPLHDPGTLNLSLSWPSGTFDDDPAVVTTLTSLDGTEEYDLEFILNDDGDGAAYTGVWDAGYYTLAIDIRQSSGYKCLNADQVITNEAVQIITNGLLAESYSYIFSDFTMEEFDTADEPEFTYAEYTDGYQDLEYWCCNPWNYDEQENDERLYPMVLYLHTSGVAMQSAPSYVYDDPEYPSKYAYLWMPTAYITGANKENYPAFIITPFCDQTKYTDYEYAWCGEVLDDIISNYRVDTSRIYIAGASMGGSGVMRLSEYFHEQYKKEFAAIIKHTGYTPAWSDPVEEIDIYYDIPIWMFIGNDDEDDSVEYMETIFYGYDSDGTEVEAGHSCTNNNAYNDDLVFEWLFAQSSEN